MSRLAEFGGEPVRDKPFPQWPIQGEEEKKNLLEVLESGNWNRYSGGRVADFERKFARLIGTDYCVGVTNGTAALEDALYSLDIGFGDEVIVPPYTYGATVTAVLVTGALPVFADIDSDTYSIDPAEVKNSVGPDTKAVIPVHFGGRPCDMDSLCGLAAENELAVIEDACQAHLAEWEGKKVGSIGDYGCFSFHARKNISCGEGGAITVDERDLFDKAYSFHSGGRSKSQMEDKGLWYKYPQLGSNYRMNEFQAALLLAQMERAEDQTKLREDRASWLAKQLEAVPGIRPLLSSLSDSVTRHAHHLFVIKYQKSQFNGLSRDRFIHALIEEGIPCMSGYTALHKEDLLRNCLRSPAYRHFYSSSRIEEYFASTDCPNAERASKEEAVWFNHELLLAPEGDLRDLVTAIEKIRDHSKELVNAGRSG